MLNILYSNGLREAMSALDQNFVEVRAYDEHEKELFRFKAAVTEAGSHLDRITEAIRTHGSPLKPNARPQETLLVVGPGKIDARPGLDGPGLGRLPGLREELLSLDREGSLCPDSMRRWLQAAERRQVSVELTQAFQCAMAALERGYLSYIRILMKDDTSVKRKAATITFDGGKKAEGVEIMKRLAQSRLQYIEKAWKR
jgi:hypothetical protein